MGIKAGLGVAASALPNLGDNASQVLSGTLAAVGPTPPFAFRGPMNLEIYGTQVATLTTTAGSLAATLNSATNIAAGAAINSKNAPPGSTVGVIAGTNVTLALPPVTLPVTGISVSSPLITLPPGSNVATLLGAAVTVPSNREGVTIAPGTTVAAIIQTDVAPSLYAPGIPGIVQLSAAPVVVPGTGNSPQLPGIPPVSMGTLGPSGVFGAATGGAHRLQFAVTGNAITATGADAAAVFTGAATTFSASVQIERSFDGGATWIVCNVGASGTLAQYTAGTPVSLTFGEPEKDVLYRLNCYAYTSGTINYRISETGGATEALAIGPLTGG